MERANSYLETSFLPGRAFQDPRDFNAQLGSWLQLANTRIHRRLGCRPADRIEADRAGMLALPPVAPSIGFAFRTRLPRDHYVRVDSNDYSVHPGAVGRLVEVTAGLERPLRRRHLLGSRPPQASRMLPLTFVAPDARPRLTVASPDPWVSGAMAPHLLADPGAA